MDQHTHGNLPHSMSYVLDKVRASERMSFLGFDSFLLAMFDYLPNPELLDSTPVHFIPIRVVPCRMDFGCFPCCKPCRFFTMFSRLIALNLHIVDQYISQFAGAKWIL